MSEFCKQCAEGLDLYNDAAGLVSTAEETDGISVVFLCEGCGFGLIKADGTCMGCPWDDVNLGCRKHLTTTEELK